MDGTTTNNFQAPTSGVATDNPQQLLPSSLQQQNSSLQTSSAGSVTDINTILGQTPSQPLVVQTLGESSSTSTQTPSKNLPSTTTPVVLYGGLALLAIAFMIILSYGLFRPHGYNPKN